MSAKIVKLGTGRSYSCIGRRAPDGAGRPAGQSRGRNVRRRHRGTDPGCRGGGGQVDSEAHFYSDRSSGRTGVVDRGASDGADDLAQPVALPGGVVPVGPGAGTGSARAGARWRPRRWRGGRGFAAFATRSLARPRPTPGIVAIGVAWLPGVREALRSCPAMSSMARRAN